MSPSRKPSELRTDETTSARLSKIPQRNTKPERVVAAALAALGWRYRRSNRGLPGSPDLANRKQKFAIFVHGCFWHHHAGCRRATIPKRNRSFWLEKFAANRRRDDRAAAALAVAGFTVVTVWECETSDQEVLLSLLNAILGRRRRPRAASKPLTGNCANSQQRATT